MTRLSRRRASFLAVVATLVAGWAYSQTGSRPCDATNDFLASKAHAQDVPTPAPTVTFEIVAPEVCLPGTFIPITARTNGKAVNVAWQFAGGLDPAHVMQTADGLTVTHIAGVYDVRAFGVVDGQPVFDDEQLRIGEPAPPKSLAELAGDHRQSLVDECQKLQAAVPALTASDKLVEVATEQFAALKLEGDPACAVKQILARIAAVDAASVVSELEKIKAELGADPTPNPKPPGPLAALVPDPAHRALLAEFYSDMAEAVRSGAFKTTTHFRAGQQEAIKVAKANGKLPTTLGAINTPISERIVAAIGLAEVPLDDAKKTALVASLESIAADFKGAN